MGQAKIRGSFEKRQQEGIARNIQIALNRKIKEAEIEAAMTPEEKAERKQAQQTLAMMAGVAVGALM